MSISKEMMENQDGQIVLVINIWPEFLSYQMAAAMTGYGAAWWRKQVAAGLIPATRPPIINSQGTPGKGDPKLEKKDVIEFLRKHKENSKTKNQKRINQISQSLK